MHDIALQHLVDEGLITPIIRPIKSGKEASVLLCRANRSITGEDLLALKRYHPSERRDFRDESVYRDGEWIKERRVRVALEKKIRFGREVQGAIWVNREWETLRALYAAGTDVPKPVARTDEAILMTYVGDEERAAPQLHRHRLETEETESLLRQIVRNVQLFLYANVIHATSRRSTCWCGKGMRR